MSIQLTIPAQAEYIDLVRLTLYGVASKAGFSYEEIEDMKVAVSEACNNATLHAYDNESYGTIHIEFQLDREQLRISIKDNGKSFAFEKINHQPSTLHQRPIENIVPGGLGIYMMHALMDSVEVRTNEGTEFILMKKLGGKEELA